MIIDVTADEELNQQMDYLTHCVVNRVWNNGWRDQSIISQRPDGRYLRETTTTHYPDGDPVEKPHVLLSVFCEAAILVKGLFNPNVNETIIRRKKIIVDVDKVCESDTSARVKCANLECGHEWTLATATTNCCPGCQWITEIYYNQGAANHVVAVYNDNPLLRIYDQKADVLPLIGLKGYSVSFPSQERLAEVTEQILNCEGE